MANELLDITQFAPQQGGLGDLATQYLQNSAFNQPPADEFIDGPGGAKIIVNRNHGGMQGLNDYINRIATQQVQNTKVQNGKLFLKGIHDIMSSNSDAQSKWNNIMALKAQHGTDYGLGVDDMAKELKGFANAGSPMKTAPEGFEVAGYDQKGNPMIRKKTETSADKKFAAEQQEKKRILDNQTEMVTNSAQDMLDTIAEVKKGITNFGLTGGFPSVPGSERANWEANVNKLLSQNVVNLLNEMKSASKTGATGFGALSQKELGVLQDASTALKKTLSPKDAEKYINKMEALSQKVLNKVTSTKQEPTNTGGSKYGHLWGE